MHRSGWHWLGLLVLGPSIWAATFALVYALHGLGCARGWSGTDHLIVMAVIAAAGAAACLFLLALWPSGPGLRLRLVRLGLWIGAVATLFTLLPLAVVPAC